MRRNSRFAAAWALLAAVFLIATVNGAVADGLSAGSSAAVPQVAAGSVISIRTGEHPGFGRVVVDLAAGMTADASQDGDRVELRWPGGAVPKLLGGPPRNVLGIETLPGGATLKLVAGATMRRARLAGRLVIDIVDAAKAGAKAPVASPELAHHRAPAHPTVSLVPATAPPPGAAAPPTRGSEPPGAAAVPSESPSASSPAVPGPVEAIPLAPAGPLSILASTKPADGGGELALPFSAETAAAAFRRGGLAVLVFDERRPIDTSLLHDNPLFGQATVRLLPAATIVELPLSETSELRLEHGDHGWRVAVDSDPAHRAASNQQPIRVAAQEGVLHFAASSPGRVVSVADEATGSTLLVGTQHRPGENVVAARHVPGVIVLRTWQGVALEPITDEVVLRADPSGFVAAAGAEPQHLALASDDGDSHDVAGASGFSQRFALPDAPIESLGHRLEAAVAAAAAAPVQSRGQKRIEVAKIMIGQGLGPEAQSVLAVAVADDPKLADDVDVVGLTAISALIADRLQEARGIDDPRLNGTDDISLWRAIRSATLHEVSPASAQAFAATLPLLMSYPSSLRDRFLPLALETMLLGGEAKKAQTFLNAHENGSGLALARAFETEIETAPGGDQAPALAAYDRLALGDDRLLRARAARRAIDLRLASHALTPAAGADATERTIYSWRGDARELASRYRTVELREQANQWRQALAMLRDTEKSWPDEESTVRSRLQAIFADASHADEASSLAPLELIELAEENADLIADRDDGGALAARLADRLSELDLPSRSADVLDHLMLATRAGPGRAAVGQRLARLRIEMGDAAGALAALAGSTAPSLPEPLATKRALVEAEALAATGDQAGALDRLSSLDSPEADELRGRLAETRGAWSEAEAALMRYTNRMLPSDGPLDAAQAAIVLRLASSAAQCGDEQALSDLRKRWTSRVPAGEASRLLNVLTESPVQDTGDLPRAAREVTFARTLNGDQTGASRPPRPGTGRPIAAR